VNDGGTAIFLMKKKIFIRYYFDIPQRDGGGDFEVRSKQKLIRKFAPMVLWDDKVCFARSS
jgi:hypothetical protein